VARDLYEGVAVARELSRMAAVMALAPLVAPLLGGVLQTYFGWRANFIVLAGFGIGSAALVWLLLPESLRGNAPEPLSFTSIVRAYGTFLGNRVFVAHLAILACTFGGLFAWISGAAFVMQDLYGLTPMGFGAAFAVGSAGYLVGTWVAVRYVSRLGIDRTIGLGGVLMACGGIASLAAPAFAVQPAAVLVAGVAVFLAGLGLSLPQAQAGALMPFPQRAGTASSLVGALQQTAGAVVGAIVGHLLGQSAWPLAAAIAIMGCLALGIWACTRAVRGSAGAATP
jgi:DHA1 family bicyclomycin/chloramphenicol resistance-like MFS transporter